MADRPIDISKIIPLQFPDYYREEGNNFIHFVQKYYEWLETQTFRVHHIINPRKSYVKVSYNSQNVIGVNTEFSTVYANTSYSYGKIAIFKSNNDYDYEIFNIQSVTNNTFMTLSPETLPTFSSTRATHGHVTPRSNPGYYVRRTPDILDIDDTLDEFVVYFKETYLKNIQFNTITDTKTLVKNSLDLYRSKGTPRSVDLLFRIAFGVPAKVFYPQVDIFRTSAANWFIPRYLELIPNINNTLFVGQQVRGLTSGATAFIQSVIRKTVQGKLIDIAYISAINGNFETGEKINSTSVPQEIDLCPTISGSLNYIDLSDSGFGSEYSIGDTLEIESQFGDQALARVANTSNLTGVIEYILVDGGYGYTNSAEVAISDKILIISNSVPNTTSGFYNEDFENVYQPLANITYDSATSANAWVAGDSIFTYHANNDLKGQGVVLLITESNTTAGEMFVSILTGDLDDASYYTTSNADSASKVTYSDKTASANVVGVFSNVTVQLTNISGSFTAGEEVKSSTSGNGIFSTIYSIVGSNATMSVVNTSSVFELGKTITGQNSGATANVVNIQYTVGVKNITNEFTALDENYFYGNSHFTNGEVSFISSGSGASISYSSNLIYTEDITIGTDLISTNATHYLPIALNATQYDFPADPSGNLTSNTIDNMLSSNTYTIGKIQFLNGQNPGSDYNIRPIVKILEPVTYAFKIRDTKYIAIANQSSDFLVGEIVTQGNSTVSTNFRGKVETANSTVLLVQKLRFDPSNDVVITTDANSILKGVTSGSIANVTVASTVGTSDFIGYDAEIDIQLNVSNGTITELQVIDSGYGFKNGEPVYLKNDDEEIGYANLVTYGTGRGFYKSRDGFLSDVKKLQDGHYWQTHSYEVRSSITLDKYKDMLKQVVHVSGHAIFGNLVHSSEIMTEISMANTGSNTIIIA